MHLDELKLWNFRKFGGDGEIVTTDGKLRTPDLSLKFNSGLNLLVGENDSGKTGIVEAIRLITKTHSNDWIKVEQEDFYKDSNHFRVECLFRGFEDKPEEAKNFTEWLGIEKDLDDKPITFLRVNLDVHIKDDKIIPSDIKAGPDDLGSTLDAGAKEYLKCIYLKPLRDAKNELTPKRNSRLSQILAGHSAFKDKENHYLAGLIKNLNENIKQYFEGQESDGGTTKQLDDQGGKELKDQLNEILTKLFPHNYITNSVFKVTNKQLKTILEGLKLNLEDEHTGLGSDNLLFIATELLLLQRDPWTGLRLGLIEELEAHLHPQAQMRVIEFLQSEAKKNHIQLILTSHSPNLASKVDLQNLIICTDDGNAFPMGPGNTGLDENKDDYNFLKRFLDVTKSNLFFAKGVLIVEGYAENILLPVIADKISKNLTDRSISIVNVGSTAFLRYAKVFIRKNKPDIPIRVAVITDFDFKPDEYASYKRLRRKDKKIQNRIGSAFSDWELKRILVKRRIKKQNVKTFFSKYWTLEYCLLLSPALRKAFYKAVLLAWKEKKYAAGVKNPRSIEKRIENIDTQFNSWEEPDKIIAFEIYNNIILKMEISKAAIAQHFAEMIFRNEVTINPQDPNIKYLLDAISFVSGE